ncbi:hypothetical protein [Erwinia sorbitola]|uniref:AraC family transcriptional regulator n=1 Tax=Erwinia sorbitola TaxID=2681984 RepID=A0A6I6EG91_9GAMM|nr:hypothetical protein [Erwinia sorbitola]MTD26509.1 hypothetical protein [Erwinia sorbitola]QGU86915.1 hypothetical protein GN242_06685 [Erwinia sorbitola]
MSNNRSPDLLLHDALITKQLAPGLLALKRWKHTTEGAIPVILSGTGIRITTRTAFL